MFAVVQLVDRNQPIGQNPLNLHTVPTIGRRGNSLKHDRISYRKRRKDSGQRNQQKVHEVVNRHDDHTPTP